MVVLSAILTVAIVFLVETAIGCLYVPVEIEVKDDENA